tara:strand:+ start:1154 stop:2071 length:918 start_codon:yes stop_codon:yes gene_type:complete
MSETIKLRPALFQIYSEDKVRRNESKTIVKQPNVIFNTPHGHLQILEKSVLFDFLNYLYVNSNQTKFAKDEFNFMYDTFNLGDVINAALADVKKVNFDLQIFLEIDEEWGSDGERKDGTNILEPFVVISVLHEGLQIDSAFASSCEHLTFKLRSSVSQQHLEKSIITKVKVNHLGAIYFCDRFTQSCVSNFKSIADGFENSVRGGYPFKFDITQLPNRYVLRARVKCGDGYVQIIPSQSIEGYLGLEEMDELERVTDNFITRAKNQNVKCTKDRVAWNRGHRVHSSSLWFSDKNKLEHENYLFFL